MTPFWGGPPKNLGIYLFCVALKTRFPQNLILIHDVL